MIINLNNSIRIVHRSKKKTHNTGISVMRIMRNNILLTSFCTLTNKIAKNCINNMINIINYWTNIIKNRTNIINHFTDIKINFTPIEMNIIRRAIEPLGSPTNHTQSY